MFGYPFDAVADIVGRTPAACRQLASRGRRAARAAGSSMGPVADGPEQRRVTERFIAACASGDLDALLAVLDPDVVGDADLGGGRRGRARVDADAVARGTLAYLGGDPGPLLLTLPGDPAVIAVVRDRRLALTVRLTVRDGLVTRLDVVVDPGQLAPLILV